MEVPLSLGQSAVNQFVFNAMSEYSDEKPADAVCTRLPARAAKRMEVDIILVGLVACMVHDALIGGPALISVFSLLISKHYYSRLECS